ncbi:alpha/beta hydrolase [Mycobacterium sp. pW049]|uniref:alpha/beta hydrolase n=1 Tax=[Mycobacterium] bulgaricum TaxID=3238985 RepID=UPI00351AC581
MSDPVLEPAAQEFADATATPPFLYELGPEGARKVLDDVQAAPIDKLDIDERWVTVPCGHGDVAVRIVTPPSARRPLPVVLYIHGGGWVLGNAATHDRLVRELAVGAHAAVAIMARQRGDVAFVQQSLYYPVTDAGQDSGSYREFAEGPFLTAKSMAWFWDCYLPDVRMRAQITASPLRASVEDLRGLPPALVIVDENDVLRDEGEAYARKLTEAGVRTTSVRFNGIIHDFMMLNPLRGTAATTAAVDLAVSALRKAFGH